MTVQTKQAAVHVILQIKLQSWAPAETSPISGDLKASRQIAAPPASSARGLTRCNDCDLDFHAK